MSLKKQEDLSLVLVVLQMEAFIDPYLKPV